MPTSRFLVRLPLSSLQASMLSSPATTPFCCPLPITVILLSLPFAAHLCRSSVNGWLLRLCPLCHPPTVSFSTVHCHPHLLPPAVVRALMLSLLTTAPFHRPTPATVHLLSLPASACLCRSPVDDWLLRPPCLFLRCHKYYSIYNFMNTTATTSLFWLGTTVTKPKGKLDSSLVLTLKRLSFATAFPHAEGIFQLIAHWICTNMVLSPLSHPFT